MEKNILLTPFNIGKETIKNRFVMGPMMISKLYDFNGGPNELGMEYFTERAKGGFGLLFTGSTLIDTKIDPFNKKYGQSPNYNPGHFIESYSKLNEKVNAYSAKMFAELTMGVGRIYSGFKAPSECEIYKHPDRKSEALTLEEIKIKKDLFFRAAATCKAAGFSGIDIHALHWGYLLDQFAMSITNHRTDEYGGCLENRLRLTKELVTGVKQICGKDFPVTMGLSCKSFIKALNKSSLHGEDEAGRTLEEAIKIAGMLQEMGVDAIMTDTGLYDSFYHACPPCYMPKGHGLNLYEVIKQSVTIPVIARSRMGDPKLCEEAVSSGMVDAVAFARPSLADPYFPKKVEMGIPEEIRPCIGCNMGCIGRLLQTGTDVSCAVNPRALNEVNTKAKKSVAPRNIAVVGGGAAGMQAALTAAECGHSVALYEKTDKLGGELIPAGAHSFKSEIHQLKDWFVNQLNKNNVPIYMNTELSVEDAKAKGYDTVIFATGAAPIMLASIKGIDKAVSAVSLLSGEAEVGKSVVIVGAGMVGCETAVDLANEGIKVTLVEALPKILSSEFVPQQHVMMLKDMLEDKNVNVITGNRLVEITAEGAVIEPSAGGERQLVKADNVVLSIGLKPNKNLRTEFYGCGIDVYEIGSARKAGNIITAVHDAFEVVYNFD